MSEHSTTARRVLQTIALALPALLLLALAWRHRWTFDDGFINFRVVRQIEAGNGPVFNAGERVEAFTSPLWIAVLSVGDLLAPLRLEWVSVVLGLTGAVGGLVAATVGAARVARAAAPGAFLVPVGALVPAVLSPFWYFATSGLEGGLTYGWIGLVFLLGARWALTDRPARGGFAALVGLGVLIRPDLLLLTVPVLAVVLVAERARGLRHGVFLAGAAVAAPVLYQLFRMGYYAQVVPNTAIAKEAGASNWDRGWDYLTRFGGDFHLWVLVPLLLLAVLVPTVLALGRERSRAIAFLGAFVVGAALSALYVVKVGGDYIPARLLLPGVFMLAAATAVVGATPRFAAAAIVPLWAAVALVHDRPSNGVYRASILVPRENVVTLDDALRSPYRRLLSRYGRPGVYWDWDRLDARPGPAARGAATTVDQSGIGIVGYALPTDVRVLDWLGLADPMTSHLRLDGPGVPGHEKPIPGVWARARLTAPGGRVAPTTLQPPSIFVPLLPLTSGAAWDRQVETARRVLRCREVRDFVRSYRGPLGFGDFLDNVGNSVSNSALRIPPDPAAARRALCGHTG